jgi:hypothetical protein
VAACLFCDSSLAPGPPWAPGDGHRLAYDPEKGRLWNVCPRCHRWNLAPLDSRWETLEACERSVRDRGTVRLSTTHLSLVHVGKGELIRIGKAPRPEFMDWRYGPRLSADAPRPGFLQRVLAGLPAPPVDGYDPYRFTLSVAASAPWLASPFLESASALTYLFSQVPLAPECPSCKRSLALRPWEFQSVRLLGSDRGPRVAAPCALCRSPVDISLADARPTLRLGLSLVTPPPSLRRIAHVVAEEMESLGGPEGLLDLLTAPGATLADLDPEHRAGLLVSLDETAEAEALETEWREAEEMAAIMDGELSHVPGFEEFRREILDRDG